MYRAYTAVSEPSGCQPAPSLASSGGQAGGHDTKEAQMRAHTTTSKRTKRIIILGLAAFGLMAGVAVATPGLRVSTSTPVRGTVAEPFKVETDGLVELKTKGPIDVADQT